MNLVPNFYPTKLLIKPSSFPTQQTICSLPGKRSFPDEFLTFQQRDIITTFQDLNKSIAPGFRFNGLGNFLKLTMIYMCSCNKMACHYRYLSGLFKVIM